MVYVSVGTIQLSGHEADAAAPTGLSGNSLTWTKVHEEVSTLTGVHQSLWRALASSPSSGAITFTFAGTKALCAWSVIEVDGADTGGTNGSNSVVQADGAQNLTGSATDAPVTLSAFADAANGAIAFAFHIGIGSTPTATPDTGWTELNEATGFEGAGYGSQASWRADNDTTVATSWSVGGYSSAIAAEINAAAATLSAPTPSGTIGTETTATIGATTDQASGTLYVVVDSAANLAGVTATQIKAGQKASGSAALAANSASVSTTTPSAGVTGLAANTLYSYAAVQNNANGDSNVVTGTFTTAAASSASLWAQTLT